MYPQLFSLGPLNITSFGLFLSLAFFSAAFICWRLGKTYDMDENKILDLVIITFLGGLVGARLLSALMNWEAFGSISRLIWLNRYPGLSFWGGLIGGAITLKLFTARLRLNFWQAADFAAVGFLIGMIFGNVGCFLSGCSYGVISNLPFATSMVGVVGKRFPVTLVESLLLLWVFFSLWNQVVRFHFAGKIASLYLIYVGIIKFLTEFVRGDNRFIPGLGLSYGHLFALVMVTLGIAAFYKTSRRSLYSDLKAVAALCSSGKKRNFALLQLKKNWYNHQVSLKIRVGKGASFLKNFPRILLRRLNVRPTPKNYF